MMKRRMASVAVLLLSGCVVDPTTSEEYTSTVPHCKTDKECEIKWAAARTWVLNNIDMKIQTYSSDFLQTFNPGEYGVELAATVNKEPTPEGYKIVISIWCNNFLGCTKPPREMRVRFNKYVTDSYSPQP